MKKEQKLLDFVFMKRKKDTIDYNDLLQRNTNLRKRVEYKIKIENFMIIYINGIHFVSIFPSSSPLEDLHVF